jgi:hypothetical protein
MVRGFCLAATFLLIFGSSRVLAQHQVPADGRFNFNVRYDVRGLDFILRLKPLTYQFDVKKYERSILKSDASHAILNFGDESVMKTRRAGFIAQDVEDAAILTGFNFSGFKKPDNKRELYTISYESFVVPLVKAVQEQHDLITELQLSLDAQKRKNEMLEKQVSSLNDKLNTILTLLEKQVQTEKQVETTK